MGPCHFRYDPHIKYGDHLMLLSDSRLESRQVAKGYRVQVPILLGCSSLESVINKVDSAASWRSGAVQRVTN